MNIWRFFSGHTGWRQHLVKNRGTRGILTDFIWYKEIVAKRANVFKGRLWLFPIKQTICRHGIRYKVSHLPLHLYYFGGTDVKPLFHCYLKQTSLPNFVQVPKCNYHWFKVLSLTIEPSLGGGKERYVRQINFRIAAKTTKTKNFYLLRLCSLLSGPIRMFI